MKRLDKKKGILLAVMFLITFLMTWLLRINITPQGVSLPAGYWNMGDVGVYLSAAILGGPWGAIVGALGAALGDIAVGQAVYAPASIIIKAIMAMLFAWYIREGNTMLHLFKGIAYAGGWMIFAYFLFDCVVRANYMIAALGLPINCLQVIASGIITVPVLFLIGGKNYRNGEGFGVRTQRGDARRSSRNLR